MISTKLASETRRMCAKHSDKAATHVRTVRGKVGGSSRTYIAFYPECPECASKPQLPARFGVTEAVRPIGK